MITAEEATDIAREYLRRNNYTNVDIEGVPSVCRFPGKRRRDPRVEVDAWLVSFPWQTVAGLYRSSSACAVLIDIESGEVLVWD